MNAFKTDCQPCEGISKPLDAVTVETHLQQLPSWDSNDAGTEIFRTFHFKNYYQTIAFVNAAAWIAHQQDHHPELSVGYNYCTVHFSTHAINGLSDNDFICAAQIDALIE